MGWRHPAAGDGESPGGTAAPPPKRAADELLFDEDVLVQVLSAVDLELADQGIQAVVEDKARLAAAMYRLQLRRLQRPGTPEEARAAIRADLRDVLQLFDALRRANFVAHELKG